MGSDLLVLQHSPWEGPGIFLREAASRHGADLRIIRVWQEALPDVAGCQGLIILGGSANVDEESRYPFLGAEKKLIAKALDHDLPCLGFCLGHQLLAAVLGARVGPNFRRSLGFRDGFLTQRGTGHPAFAGLPRRFPMFEWHGQAVLTPAPRQIEILATSEDCLVEAFSLAGRPHVLGVQFDNQAAHPRDVAAFFQNDDKWRAEADFEGADLEETLAEAEELRSLMNSQFSRFLANFLAFLTPDQD